MSERIVDLPSFDQIAAAEPDSIERPTEALDGILDLTSFFRSDTGRAIARSHIDYYAHRRITVEGGNLPLSVPPTREERYEREGWQLTEGWLGLFDEIVGTGGTVYVTPRMVKIISDLAGSLPEPPVLHATDVPFEVGTVWLGRPITLGEYAEKNHVPIRVISWTTTEPIRFEETNEPGAGVTMMSFSQGTEIVEVNRLAARTDEDVRRAEEVIIGEGVKWLPWETMGWNFGEAWREATPEETEAFERQDHSWTREDSSKGIPEPDLCLPQGVRITEQAIVRRFLYVLWRMMSEGVAVQVEHRPDRHSRRRVERSKRPDLSVRVIHLRRLYDPSVVLTEEEKAERRKLDREWSHRWRVRTHWRKQPIGPRGSGLYRMVRIESYVKGPEEKPLIEKPTVWSLER